MALVLQQDRPTNRRASQGKKRSTYDGQAKTVNIALTTNINGGKGLTRDYALLAEFLQSLGHSVLGVQYDEPLTQPYTADLMISLETIARHHLPIAPIHWLIPNLEWLTADSIPVIDKHFAKILTKTREAQRILEPVFPGRVHYCGFLCRDQYDPTVPRERKFLHVGGEGAVHRNTAAVVDAWRWKQNSKGIDAELIVVSSVYKGEAPDGVTVLPRVSEEELKRLQNACLFHLCPSATEGWGHVLHEALSVDAILMTTNAAPMNEVPAKYLVPSTGQSKFNFATAHEVSAIGIYTVCQMMLDATGLPRTREFFKRDNDSFRKAFGQHVADVDLHKPMPKWKRSLAGIKSIAFLGNFKHTFCTESDLAWSAEFLGHEVIRLQENEVTLRDLDSAFQADMFLWVRTPGFLRIPDDEMYKFLDRLEDASIPSVSFHLDKFWGIPEREELIGNIPFWQTDLVFSADGGHTKEFIEKGVEHRWMLPGVVLRGCYPGVPQPDLACDVGFVGSVDGYHPCYPERKELVEFLKHRYGHRFRSFQGYREQRLNDLYASIKVCVGDSIFANQGKSPKYVSDRVTETMGRGGVLVHPEVEGVYFPGWVTHWPGDFEDLARKIDDLLLNPEMRRDMRDVGMSTIRKLHTYDRRIQTILGTVFP
jgi:hypothetical protein